jgi:predicted TIM-barrel fold metal-dependent hydrolase
MFAEIIGKLLFWCGEYKIVYGSEAPIFHPQWALRAFMGLRTTTSRHPRIGR